MEQQIPIQSNQVLQTNGWFYHRKIVTKQYKQIHIHIGASLATLHNLTIADLSQGHRTPGCEVANLHPAYATVVDHWPGKATNHRVMEKRCMTATCNFLWSSVTHSNTQFEARQHHWRRNWSHKSLSKDIQRRYVIFPYIFYTSGEGMQQSGTRNAEHRIHNPSQHANSSFGSYNYKPTTRRLESTEPFLVPISLRVSKYWRWRSYRFKNFLETQFSYTNNKTHTYH